MPSRTGHGRPRRGGQRGELSLWQQLGVLTQNLVRAFQLCTGALPRKNSWKRTTHFVFASLQTERFEFIHQPARLVRPAGQGNSFPWGTSIMCYLIEVASTGCGLQRLCPLTGCERPAISRSQMGGQSPSALAEFTNQTGGRVGPPPHGDPVS